MKRLNKYFFFSARHYSKKYADNCMINSPQVTLPLNFIHGHRKDSHSTTLFQLVAPAYDKLPAFGRQLVLLESFNKSSKTTICSSGQILRNVPNSNEKDVNEAINSARQSFRAWSRRSGFERGQVLKRAASIIRNRVEELAHTEVLDTGKPLWEARFDILGCADTIEYYGGLAATLTGEFLQLAGGSFAYTLREPLGVVAGIGAWNYPLQMASWKSSPALACGNTFVFKPSQFTPLTAVMLGEIYHEAGLPDGCYNVVQGESETGQLLCSHPGVDKVSFTGSVPTGSKIMANCAKDIKHITLELGGKSPLIIFSDADIDNAVKGSMLANFTNQGQVCSNGTRVFVEESIADNFLEKLIQRVDKMKIGDPMLEDTTVGAMITPEHGKKVSDYIELGKREGTTVAYGGERVRMEDEHLAGGYYLRPCILTNCEDDMQVVREEIFGGVMSILTFKSEEEVVRRANDTEFGLAGGVFTRDLQRAHRVVSNLETGSIYVNNYNVYPVGVPFGGYKKSGIGRENGADTLNYYSQIKSVYMEGGDVNCPY